MKKIGVLTYLKEYANLGTNMQSYCTMKAVQKAYPDAHVELIDYSGWKPAKRPYLSQVSVQSLRNDFVRMRKYDRFFKQDLTLSQDHLISPNFDESIEFIKKQQYDAIYVGSDTLLELKRADENSLTAYWLHSSITCKKFLIAASSHNVDFDTLSESQRRKMQETVDGYSLLGVRDEATQRLLSHFTDPGDKRLQVIPDPTFTYDINYNYIDAYLKRKKFSFDKPVVCLHLLRDTKWAAEIAAYFRKEGYVIASLRPAYYADILFTDLSPFEQVGLYKYFDLVITHRFHDAIFSIKNNTPVIVFAEHVTDVTRHGDNKNKTLLKAFKIEDTSYISNKEAITAKYMFDIHKEAIRNFREKESFIKARLKENKERYEQFVIDSRNMLMRGDRQ